MTNSVPVAPLLSVPAKIKHDGQAHLCEWTYVGQKRFTEPFFDDTLSLCRAFPENGYGKKPQTPLAALPAMAAGVESLPLKGVIFHVSRCGSTLLAQLLALQEQHIVLAEVPFLDDALRLSFQDPAYSTATSLELFAAAIRLYGRRRTENETSLFIKADSWHLFFYEQYRALYPDLPFILLYRNPADVLESHRKQRGIHAVPGLIEPAVFGFTRGEEKLTNLDLYLSQVLQGYFEKMEVIAAQDPKALLLDYADGSRHLTENMFRFFDLPYTQETAKQVEARSAFHAKKPGEVFAEKKEEKPVPDYLQPVMDLYQQLRSKSSVRQQG